MDINFAINNNAIWVRCYDSTNEVNALKRVLEVLNLRDKTLSVIDVGCGNGRSLELLKKVLSSKSKIIGIDKLKENITYCNHLLLNNIKLKWIDAVDFFSCKENESNFDLVLFSWSLFDMFDESDEIAKYNKLSFLLNTVKKCLSKEGVIIVLQPTKGGTFEKLLSLFMPGSDDDYLLAHRTLMDLGFKGAITAFPAYNEEFAIWSKFSFDTLDELYDGVESILYLEQRKLLDKNDFYAKWNYFCNNESLVFSNDQKTLSDCVNVYYLRNI